MFGNSYIRKPDHKKAIGYKFINHYTFPASVLTASGSMGIISASKAPLVSFNY
ncbi:hypothetical protein GCM10019994_14920 [Enterococcus raffinosus]|nr:hypothetical protein NUITMVRE36_27410 [Enterococcus raffinosus]